MTDTPDTVSDKWSAKKIITAIATIISFIICVVVWGVVCMFGLLISAFGGFDALIHLYSNGIVIVLILIGLSLLIVPFFLKKFIKPQWARAIISAAMAFVFIVLCAAAMMSANDYFSDFTKEKWLEYPELRYMMSEGLKNNHGLIGMTAEEVIVLLGEPNVKHESVYTYYCSKKDYSGISYVEVLLEEGKAVKVRDFFLE